MTNPRWPLAIVAVLAAALIAAGCGDEESDAGSTASSEATVTSEDSTTEQAATPASESGMGDADEVYDACVDAVAGSPAEGQSQTACEQARSAFEQCAEQADVAGDNAARESAIEICRQAADQAIAALEASG
jgi:hypothetical protein